MNEGSLRNTIEALRKLPITNAIVEIKEDFFDRQKNKTWESSCALLVFPGGRDRPYQQELRIHLPAIKTYVEQGGNYLGICAGAYFACEGFEFAKGIPDLHLKEKRDLKFFPGVAVGPIRTKGKFSYNAETGAEIVQLAWQQEISEQLGSLTTESYYNGGCYFEDAAIYHDLGVKVHAYYTAQNKYRAAIVECKPGKGTALLTGAHIEHPQSTPKVFSSLLTKIFPDCFKKKVKQQKLVNHI